MWRFLVLLDRLSIMLVILPVAKSKKENVIVKNHRLLTATTAALLTVGYLMIPAAAKAANPDSPEVAKLLADTKSVTTQLKTDSSEMESFSRSKLSWQSYADKIEIIKGHVNNAGQLLSKLKASESAGSPSQQSTVKLIEPMLQEMADNLTATINHLNDNKEKVHMPAFRDYVKANYTMAVELETLVRTSVDYGKDKSKFEDLSTK
jgi:hypothetical protein